MSQTNTASRQRLFRHNPHCFWCGKLTMLSVEVRLKHDTATVDHLYSRLHPNRKVARQGRGRLVLACNQCNKDRSNAETRGLMFVPKLADRKPIAEMTTVTPLGSPIYKGSGQRPRQAVLNPPKDDFGWIDNNGDLRPRSWEEYVMYRSAFIGPAFGLSVKPIKPVKSNQKRVPLCTIGELIRYQSERGAATP